MLSKKLVVKNSLISMLTQFISMILGFITSRVFLHYLGLEIRGVNSVVGETLSFLSMAELGIGSAITYRLYKPLVEDDQDTVKSLMKVYQTAYRIIAIAVLLIGLVMMVFLRLIIKDQTMDFSFIRIVYLIQLVTSASTYCFAYKRSLIYTNQKQYICKVVDLSTNVIFSILRIWVMIQYRNYIAYLVLQLLQSVISNVIISGYCNRLYPYMKDKNVKPFEDVRSIFKDTKNILFGKMAAYIWSSTDNIVVTAFKGLVSAGGLTTYKFVVNAVRNILHSVTEPMTATIGNFLQVKDKNDCYKMLKTYIFFRYAMVNITATGLIVCLDSFVGLFYGDEYILNLIISILLVADIFIGVIYGPMAEMINLLGYFSQDKIINFVGAFVNLGTSIILVQLVGMKGVLIGTVISQVVFLIGKTVLIAQKYFYSKKYLRLFLIHYVEYTLVTACQVWGLIKLFRIIFPVQATVLIFLTMACSSVVIALLVMYILWGKTEEYHYMINLIKNTIKNKK